MAWCIIIPLSLVAMDTSDPWAWVPYYYQPAKDIISSISFSFIYVGLAVG